MYLVYFEIKCINCSVYSHPNWKVAQSQQVYPSFSVKISVKKVFHVPNQIEKFTMHIK